MYFSHKGSCNASPEVSCSDCKLELVRKTWARLLLRWMNRCVNQELHLKILSRRCLVEIINRYKEDIVDDDIDRAILCTDDLEPFLRYKYPILRLRYLTEEKDAEKKVYIMMSVLMYHCCVCSHTGAVENDICNKLIAEDREMILKFCENLSDMEITINNVDVAIERACEGTSKPGSSHGKKRPATPHASKAAVMEENMCSATSSTVSDVSSKKIKAEKVSTLTFKASVTVMPSHVSVNASSYSKTSLQPDSSLETLDTYSSKQLEDFSTTTMTADSTGYNMTEKNESDQNFDNKSDKTRTLYNSNFNDDTTKPMSPKNKRDGKLPMEQNVVKIALDSKEGRYNREANRKSDGSIDSRRHSVEVAGDSNRLRRDVCPLPQDKLKTCLSNESKSDRCSCVITTSDEIINDMIKAYGDSLLPQCKGRENLGAKKRDKSMEKKFKIKPRTHTTLNYLYSFLKGPKCPDDKSKMKWVVVGVLIALLFMALVIGTLVYFLTRPSALSVKPEDLKDISYKYSGKRSFKVGADVSYPTWAWQCTNRLCMKVFKPKNNTNTYSSLSRCILLCTGPKIWPYPLGMTYFSKELVGLATDRLEYRFQAVPSDMVNQYLAGAFKLFIKDLAKLESIDKRNKNRTHDMEIKKMHINIEVETDPDPRMRLNTDESYYLKIVNANERVKININSPSFPGVRHGLETLSQVILLDQSTGYLITLSEVIVKDAPTYKYRGLMLDTARNYIPVHDILRTIDGMATCKLNTFHWRITDSASFPLLLPSLTNLFQYGAYDRSMVYTKQDINAVVSRAAVRGIRVLIEVAIPGPVGRAWSWSDDATCQRKTNNLTCDNILCLRLKMQHSVFELLQHLYSEIIDMTGVDDIFHMSDSVFSMSNCHNLIEEREGFLEKALERLRRANKGFLPKLPIIWYTQHLSREKDAKFWDRYGVQVYEWPSHPDTELSRYKVIHSERWDLSCNVKKQRCTKYRTWQEMYGWKTWCNIRSFTVEGGEALLWTDLVDSGNLDFHLWPRAAAVAERLWSDLVINATAGGDVYIRLDNHRWRMLLRGLQVQPIWPVWCSFNPGPCLSKLALQQH